ncbi:unnamed protein product [Vitrella brassicaformis CCMP3155]|uniref:Trimethylguanosine synthase n=1 Tax=Vitrella brassicaformis (strain CCMP3155) TaxID=1169540 RepID=A0A0G4G6T5_VITBC|nr:unnamed protein product [Vitrella brassicaformis CCMP3155]|eukprot:CEM23921.1 unnamed protein product [Vitrella brassicaformis CCMP3155]
MTCVCEELIRMEFITGVWGILTRWIARLNDAHNTTTPDDEEPRMSVMDMLMEEILPTRPPPVAFLKANLMLPDGTVIKHTSFKKSEGEFVFGKRRSQGTFSFADGAVFEGQWVNGELHGHAEYLYADEGVYQGEWRDDKRRSEGAVTSGSAEGNVVEEKYEGEWVNGEAEYLYADEGVYQGEWMHGKGTYMFPNGNVYEGEWVNDMKEGSATLTCQKVEKYENTSMGHEKVIVGTNELQDAAQRTAACEAVIETTAGEVPVSAASKAKEEDGSDAADTTQHHNHNHSTSMANSLVRGREEDNGETGPSSDFAVRVAAHFEAQRQLVLEQLKEAETFRAMEEHHARTREDSSATSSSAMGNWPTGPPNWADYIKVEEDHTPTETTASDESDDEAVEEIPPPPTKAMVYYELAQLVGKYANKSYVRQTHGTWGVVILDVKVVDVTWDDVLTRRIFANDSAKLSTKEMREGASPESIAAITAQTVAASGNAIQFCLSGLNVCACEIKKPHTADAQANFEIYGVKPAVVFEEPFYTVTARMQKKEKTCDFVFADLPWGGARFVKGQKEFDITRMGYEGEMSVFDVMADTEAVTSSWAFKLPRNTPFKALAELGAWDATREVYRGGHPLVSYRPPVIEAYVTRVRRGGQVEHRLKYTTVYVGHIADRIARRLPPSRATTCPLGQTTIDDRVNSGAMTNRSERLQLVFK